MTAALATELGRIVGPRWVRVRPAELAAYEADGLPTHASRPALAVIPGTKPELIAVLRLLHLASVPFVARGRRGRQQAPLHPSALDVRA